MDKFGILFFLTFIGLSITEEFHAFERQFTLDGQKSGFYFTHKGELNDNSMNGIVPMYHKISEDSAFYAIFHYNRNNFAAVVAVKMFRAALKTVEPISYDAHVEVNWKTFLQQGLKKIDDRLMQDDITGDCAESETRALIAVVDRNKVTLAQIGDMRKVLLVNIRRNARNDMQSMRNVPPELVNVLGGKATKARNPKIHGVADVNEFPDLKYLIMGTKSLWRLSDHQIARKVLENVRDLKKAAQEVTNSMVLLSDEKDNGIVVIDVKHSKGEKTILDKMLSCLNL